MDAAQDLPGLLPIQLKKPMKWLMPFKLATARLFVMSLAIFAVSCLSSRIAEEEGSFTLEDVSKVADKWWRAIRMCLPTMIGHG